MDPSRRETSDALLYPDRFSGILVESNLDRAAATCPGPALQLARLNREVSVWRFRATTVDMEDWVADLGVAARVGPAVARFALAGSLATPLLLEVAQEGAADLRVGAVRALEAVGDAAAAPALATLLGKATEPGFEQALLRALAQVGTPQQRTAVAERLADTRDDPARLARLAAVIVALARPGVPEDLAPLAPLAAHPDVTVRAQVAFGAVARRAGRHAAGATDASGAIRLLAAESQGPAGVGAAVETWQTAGAAAVIAALRRLSPERTVPATLARLAATPLPDLVLALDLMKHWKPPGPVVHAVAPRLATAHGLEQQVLVQTLRKITGRDLGSGPEGWSHWTPSP